MSSCRLFNDRMVMLLLLAALCSSFIFKAKPHSHRCFDGLLRSSFGTGSSLQSVSDSDQLTSLIDRVKANVKPGAIVVIKYGGHAMENSELRGVFYDDIACLYRDVGITPVVVHGGGPQIQKMLTNLSVKSNFIDGLRVTDDATMEIAQMVLCGTINKEIASRISQRDGVVGAFGLSGLDSGLIKAVRKDVRLGLVGEPVSVNADIIHRMISMGIIPIIAPVGTDKDSGGSLNINADTAAGAVAEALGADYFLLLTDIVGVLDKDKVLIERIPVDRFQSLKDDGTITGGMIPKLETAVQAVRAGVGAVSIMDGRVPHSVLRAISGESFGTVITKTQ